VYQASPQGEGPGNEAKYTPTTTLVVVDNIHNLIIGASLSELHTCG